jgi:hypothetical protein
MRLRKLLGALFAAASLSATAAIPTTETAELVEFYNASLDHYFITTDAEGDLRSRHRRARRVGAHRLPFLVDQVGQHVRRLGAGVPLLRPPREGHRLALLLGQGVRVRGRQEQIPRHVGVRDARGVPRLSGQRRRLVPGRHRPREPALQQPARRQPPLHGPAVRVLLHGRQGLHARGRRQPQLPDRVLHADRRLGRPAARARRPRLHGHREQPDARPRVPR